MKTLSPEPSRLSRLHLSLGQARFFTLSAIFHLGLVVIIGGIVLIEPKADVFNGFRPTEVIISTPESEVFEKPNVPGGEDGPKDPAAVGGGAPEPAGLYVLAGLQAPGTVRTSTPDQLGSALNGIGKFDGSLIGKGIGSGPGPGMNSGFGDMQRGGPALVGTFYDLKQTRARAATGVSPDEFHKIFRRFVREGWREQILETYFKAPNRLYTAQLFIPNMSAQEGPKAFGLENEVQPSRWLALYKGRVSPPADGTYHFVGGGDDVLVVRFNGKVVLDRCWYQEGTNWKPQANYDYGFTGIPNGFAKGDPIKVRASETYDLEVLIGEQPGMFFYSCLLMEKEGAVYQRDGKGNPILPIFRTANVPPPALAEGQSLPPFEPDGPVWKVVATGMPQ